MSVVAPEPFALPSAVLGEPIRGYLLAPAEPPVGVAYLLHGRGGCAEDWLARARRARPSPARRRAARRALERARELVRRLGGARWAQGRDRVHAGSRARDRRRFPRLATREQRLVGGVSMGGAGALRLALAHPAAVRTAARAEPGDLPAASAGGLEASAATAPSAAGRRASTCRPTAPCTTGACWPPRRRCAPSSPSATRPTSSARPRRWSADLAGAGSPAELHVYPGGHGWDAWAPALQDGLRALVTSATTRP